MDNEKRALLAIVLSILVLFLYQYLFAPSPPIQKRQETFTERTEQPEPSPPQVSTEVPQLTIDNQIAKLKTIAPSPYPEKQIMVSTDLFTAIFSTQGAVLKSFKLHNYKDKIETPVVMKLFKKLFSSKPADADMQMPQSREMISLEQTQQFPLRSAFIVAGERTPENDLYKTDKETLELDAQNTNDKLILTQKNAQGPHLEKIFFFQQNKYGVDYQLTIKNASKNSIVGSPLLAWTNSYSTENGQGFFGVGNNTSSKFTYYINGKVEKIELKEITENKRLEGEILWTSFEEKYFISSIIPREEKPYQINLVKLTDNLVAYQLIYPSLTLQPGESKSYHFSLYLGPRDVDILEKQNAKLEKTIDFGVFDLIAKPLLVTLKFFYKFVGNYGLSIIFLTIIIKILFWPLTQKSFKSMKDMQKLQPEMAKLKEKYKDKKEELNRETMGLYKKYKVNPLGGCLPMLLQIPVFIALYRVLLDSIELRHASFISFWINDLSAKDPTYVSPLLMGASMFLQQKMTPTSADPAQAKMMLFMPIVFTFMFLSFPSGLVIYWLVNNVLSIAQQVYINKKSQDGGGSKWSPPKSKQKLSKKQSR
jgi:YidC/Oxa1 family membrane protein insertase